MSMDQIKLDSGAEDFRDELRFDWPATVQYSQLQDIVETFAARDSFVQMMMDYKKYEEQKCSEPYWAKTKKCQDMIQNEPYLVLPQDDPEVMRAMFDTFYFISGKEPDFIEFKWSGGPTDAFACHLKGWEVYLGLDSVYKGEWYLHFLVGHQAAHTLIDDPVDERTSCGLPFMLDTEEEKLCDVISILYLMGTQKFYKLFKNEFQKGKLDDVLSPESLSSTIKPERIELLNDVLSILFNTNMDTKSRKEEILSLIKQHITDDDLFQPENIDTKTLMSLLDVALIDIDI